MLKYFEQTTQSAANKQFQAMKYLVQNIHFVGNKKLKIIKKLMEIAWYIENKQLHLIIYLLQTIQTVGKISNSKCKLSSQILVGA